MADILIVLEKFGLPALITTAGSILLARLRPARKGEPVKEILQWLDSDATRRLIAADPTLATALTELQKAVAFERAFGVRAESGRREALLRFWEDKKGWFTMREVGQGSRKLAWDGERFQPRSPFVDYSDRTMRFRAFVSRQRLTILTVAFLCSYGLILLGFIAESTFARIFYIAGGLALLVPPFVWFSTVKALEVSDALMKWSREGEKKTEQAEKRDKADKT